MKQEEIDRAFWVEGFGDYLALEAGSGAAVWMTILLVRTTLPHQRGAEVSEDPFDLTGLEDRDVRHAQTATV